MSRLEKAIAFAVKAHEGQGYGDSPFILHPMRVMLAVAHLGESYSVVAMLHDCMDDAGVLPDWLADVEREAVDLLSHDPALSYRQRIERIEKAAMTTRAGIWRRRSRFRISSAT